MFGTADPDPDGVVCCVAEAPDPWGTDDPEPSAVSCARVDFGDPEPIGVAVPIGVAAVVVAGPRVGRGILVLCADVSRCSWLG